jgi:hypothetical protein
MPEGPPPSRLHQQVLEDMVRLVPVRLWAFQLDEAAEGSGFTW